MGTFIQPTKCFVQEFNMAGVDVVRHVNQLRAFETVCKPYITAQVIIYDTNNMINNMGLVGGEAVNFTINSVYDSRSYQLFILSVKGEESSQNLRTQKYTIEMIGTEYFGDKGNLVQHSFKQITGTDAISKIHSQFLGSGLRVPVPSAGLIGKDNAYVVSSMKPFKAIDDIRKFLTFAQYQTGATVFFKDRDGSVLAPLEHLFATLSSQQTFLQEATWGKSFVDLARVENSIIAAAASVNPADKSGRTGVQSISSKTVQERKVMDLMSNKKVFDIAAKSVAGGAAAGTSVTNFLGSMFGGSAGSHGGEHNYYFADSTKIPQENTRHTEKEKMYQAQIANGPQLTLKVPIQSGIRCTVGRGIYAKLMPPIGDQTSPEFQASQTGGDMLVVDLMHEVHLDDKMMAGTTTMRCAKGGFTS